MGRVARVAVALGSVAAVLGFTGPAAQAGQIRAGVGMADASWHVGASAGQYASTQTLDPDEFDPHVQSFKNRPSYGVQSRLTARALVVSDGQHKLAVVKDDLYIPQDALTRRVGQLLAARGTGFSQANITVAVTHDHSSPYYTSTAAGTWTFQDVFDIRAYDHYAHALADAVTRADAAQVPVRVGAGVVPFAKSNRNALGPAVADDGTPAGFPDSYTDRDLTLVRFDDISDPAHPKPLANLLNFSLHGENLDGNDLISADWVGPAERMLDRTTGAFTVVTQNAVGNSENERDAYHSVHDRLLFEHRQYGQAEYNASLIAGAALDVWRSVGAGRSRVPFFRDGPVLMADRWFPGPVSHPLPTVSNCRTEQLLSTNPKLPVVGLPDCTSPFDEAGFGVPRVPSQNPGILPSNVSVPSFLVLEEDASIHLQAFRVGPILFTVCSCEQWADQSRNIKTRTDRVAGNEWMGFDWATYRGLDDTGVECFELPPYDGSRWNCPHPDRAKTKPCERVGSSWSCPDPTKECLLKGYRNTCRGTPADARLPAISDGAMARMKAQVRNCANGWDTPDAETEPADPAQIKGPYTCDDDERSAGYGYALTVPISMANDYNGYIATYREYQRGDHYRKALTGWGPHSSDYMATNLVGLARQLQGAPPPPAGTAAQQAKTAADQAVADAKVQALGVTADQVIAAYGASVPAAAGSPAALIQPKDVQRFDVASFTWRGGSNYTDNPIVRVERLVRGTWEPFADESGEVPVTLRFPSVGDLPSYLTGGQEWRWTAWFEAFVSRYDLPGSARATPVGTYRFVATGRAASAYRVESAPFRVGAWSGLTTSAPVVGRSRRVSVVVGPAREVKVPGGRPATATLGPVDYPDGWDDRAGRPRFIQGVRSFVRDPAFPDRADKFEWYCLACAFRPWQDTGRASRVVVTFARGTKVVARVRAHRNGPSRWLTRRTLRRGESAYVCAGGVRDRWGNLNGAPSAVAGRSVKALRCPTVTPVGTPNGRHAPVVSESR